MPERLYLDCFSGISGDMFLGVLLDLGLPLKDLQDDLAKIGFDGLRIRKQNVLRAGLRATQVRISVPDTPQPHRGLNIIRARISRSKLTPSVKRQATAVFTALAEAEARIHGVPVDQVHFHEVGALDAIADVVGTVAGLERLGFSEIACGAVNVGGGFVESHHGTLPVPAPAALDLLQGFTVYSRGPQAELATPTGAALLQVLAEPAAGLPEGRLQRTGYGAGGRDFPGFGNCLRAWVLEEADTTPLGDEVAVLTTNVDDATPQVCAFALERVLAAGALDALFKPVQMKKNRPAQQLEVICQPEQARELAELLFEELPTLGVRVSLTRRLCLSRRMDAVRMHGSLIRVKRGLRSRGQETLVPEYEDAKDCALRTGLPLRQVLAEACEHARTGKNSQDFARKQTGSRRNHERRK